MSPDFGESAGRDIRGHEVGVTACSNLHRFKKPCQQTSRCLLIVTLPQAVTPTILESQTRWLFQHPS